MVGLLDLAARGACEAALARCLDRLQRKRNITLTYSL